MIVEGVFMIEVWI